MINTFKETWTSLQDLKYGEKIVAKTVQQCVWYWSQYFVVLTLITWILIIAVVTYFTPQLSKTLNDKLPDVDIAIKDGLVESSVQQPYILKDKNNFAFILDINGKPEDLNDYDSGLIIFKDRLIAKEDSNETRIYEFKDVKDFYIDKSMITTWIKKNTPKLWGIVAVAITVLGALWAVLVWSWQLSTALLWSTILWAATKIFKKDMTFQNCYKIIIYASVLPLLIGWISTLSPNPFTPWLTFGLMGFYAVGWTFKISAAKSLTNNS